MWNRIKSPAPPAPPPPIVAEPAPRVIQTAHENGHFYSPVCDPEQLSAQATRLWPAEPSVLGIDFNDAEHTRVLDEVFPRHIAQYDYPETLPDGAPPTQYFTQNSQFSWLDSRTLFVLLQDLRPKRLMEIGSGYSTLLTCDVNARWLGGELAITCVEPYPRPFLHALPGVDLIEDEVQNVPLSTFEQLRAGDVLFIDSSHVAKTGSDVNYLYFDVLPRLAAGVVVHIHDIFLPHEYKREWVLDENRSWNEQYLLRALLMYSARFRVRFGCNYAVHRFPEKVRQALALPDGRVFGGGSIWIDVI